MGGHEGFSSQRLSRPTWFSHLCASARRFKVLAPPSSETAVASTSGESLVRRLGLIDLILLGVGASIGAGVFVVTGTVARDAGPGVTISFLLAGASCVLNALCYAELSSRFPAVVGGAYMYSYSAFNEITAFLVFVQLMLDYHIGAASISRSLASYAVALLELFPALKGSIPLWLGSGKELLGGFLSLNILAPILLALLTLVLCQGVRESSALNSVMTATKVVIVLIVICVGAFDIDVANWSPFAPNGFKAILTGATVVFFSYVGFDAVANSAEESKNPQRDLPIGIMGSLLVCISLYIGVCLVLTGMVPFSLLSEDAPLAEAFSSKGMKFVSILISVGAVAGLTTTLLVGLYVQSRLYLGLGRDGLLPSIFSRIHPTLHTPIHSQIWCGIIAGGLAGLFNVHSLSHILSVGTLTGYSVVAACVVALRLNDKKERESSNGWTSSWHEGVIGLVIIACSGFCAGVFYRFSASVILLLLSVGVAVVASAALHYRQAYAHSLGSGFYCPGVPIVPCVCIFFNIFLFAQLHYEAWIRFVVVSVLATAVYALYGQYHADTSTLVYQRAPDTESDSGVNDRRNCSFWHDLWTPFGYLGSNSPRELGINKSNKAADAATLMACVAHKEKKISSSSPLLSAFLSQASEKKKFWLQPAGEFQEHFSSAGTWNLLGLQLPHVHWYPDSLVCRFYR